MAQLSNSAPRGMIQGDLAVIEFRALGLDGHASVGLDSYAFTRHALLSLLQTASELLQSLEEAGETNVEEMRRRHG